MIARSPKRKAQSAVAPVPLISQQAHPGVNAGPKRRDSPSGSARCARLYVSAWPARQAVAHSAGGRADFLIIRSPGLNTQSERDREALNRQPVPRMPRPPPDHRTGHLPWSCRTTSSTTTSTARTELSINAPTALPRPPTRPFDRCDKDKISSVVSCTSTCRLPGRGQVLGAPSCGGRRRRRCEPRHVMARFLNAQAPTMLAGHFFRVDSAVTLNGSTSSSLWKSATATSTSSGEDRSGGDTSREFS